MKTAILILSIVSGLLLVFTIICGLWIRTQGTNVDPSSLSFHLGIALAASGSSILTLILAVSSLMKSAA